MPWQECSTVHQKNKPALLNYLHQLTWTCVSPPFCTTMLATLNKLVRQVTWTVRLQMTITKHKKYLSQLLWAAIYFLFVHYCNRTPLRCLFKDAGWGCWVQYRNRLRGQVRKEKLQEPCTTDHVTCVLDLVVLQSQWADGIQHCWGQFLHFPLADGLIIFFWRLSEIISTFAAILSSVTYRIMQWMQHHVPQSGLNKAIGKQRDAKWRLWVWAFLHRNWTAWGRGETWLSQSHCSWSSFLTAPSHILCILVSQCKCKTQCFACPEHFPMRKNT